MRINSITNRISNFSTSAKQRVVDVMPRMVVSNEKTLKSLKWIGEKVSSPQNRLILGISALLSQPFIDLSNKKVDDETRKVSAARTVAKIIAGTTTGVAIRSACIHSIDALSVYPEDVSPNMKFKKLRSLFAPSKGLLENLNQYKKSLGTILSLVVMVFTNFLIDAPWTKFLTNKFVDKIKKNESVKIENNNIAKEDK